MGADRPISSHASKVCTVYNTTITIMIVRGTIIPIASDGNIDRRRGDTTVAMHIDAILTQSGRSLRMLYFII